MPQPDYENDLVFEPKMTFRDLCSWCRQKNYPNVEIDDDTAGGESIYIDHDEYNVIEFDIAGIIAINGDLITASRTPKQMQTIIKNLFE